MNKLLRCAGRAKVGAAGPGRCRRRPAAGTHDAFATTTRALPTLPTLFAACLQGKLGFNYRVSWYLLYCVLWVSEQNSAGATR